MTRKEVRQLLAIGVCLAILWGVAQALLFAPFPESQNIARGVFNFDELSGRFSALAESKGANYAFEVLKRAKLPQDTDLHLLAHVVGDELYKQKGVGGIAEKCVKHFEKERFQCSCGVKTCHAVNVKGRSPWVQEIEDEFPPGMNPGVVNNIEIIPKSKR